MKKQVQKTILLLAVLISYNMAAQYPPGDVTITSQEDVDNFIINYPNCTIIDGNLTLCFTSAIRNLQGLSNINSITGTLRVSFVPGLESFQGLENLTTVTNIFIWNNDALTSLSGLEGVDQPITELTIDGNPVLANIDGLGNVEAISDKLVIRGNTALSTLAPLSGQLSELGELTIDNNSGLTTLAGLEGLTTVSTNGGATSGEVFISNNE